MRWRSSWGEPFDATAKAPSTEPATLSEHVLANSSTLFEPTLANPIIEPNPSLVKKTITLPESAPIAIDPSKNIIN